MSHHNHLPLLLEIVPRVRADERTVVEIRRRLRRSSFPALRQVRCELHEGMLTLVGRVPSYHCKQIAQTLARQVDDTLQVVNRLLVIAPVATRDWDEELEVEWPRVADDVSSDAMAGDARNAPLYDDSDAELLRFPLCTMATTLLGETSCHDEPPFSARPR